MRHPVARELPPFDADALLLLSADHTLLQAMFYLFERADPQRHARIATKIIALLAVHVQIEEEVFYPAAAAVLGPAGTRLVNAASLDHATTRAFMAQIRTAVPGSRLFASWVRVLGDQVERHIAQDEQHLFPRLRACDRDLREISVRLASRKAELTLISELEMARTRSSRVPAIARPSATLRDPSPPGPDATASRLRLVPGDGPWFVQEYRLSRQ